jgi:ankyrin repeat protein
MNKIRVIIEDGLILFLVSTVLVVVADMGFSKLKGKTPKDDPIVTAIVQGNATSLAELVKPGESVTEKADAHGRTALMRAAYANIDADKLRDETDGKRAPMIQLLVSNGAKIDTKDNDGWSPLMWAAWSDMPKTAAVLIENGASPATADKHGNTALILAARRGNVEIVRLLAATGDTRAALEQAKTGLAEYPEKRAAYHEIIPMLEK